jgi:hypothetical protein
MDVLMGVLAVSSLAEQVILQSANFANLFVVRLGGMLADTVVTCIYLAAQCRCNGVACQSKTKERCERSS